jgi:hypothetical protein
MYTPGEFPLEAIQAIKYSNGESSLERACYACARADQRCVAATLSALLWEACITFADEADFIWSYVRVFSGGDGVLTRATGAPACARQRPHISCFGTTRSSP